MKPVVKIGTEAIEDMASALFYIAHAVGSTLGPGGRVSVFDKIDINGRLTASMTKDGLTVLRSLGFSNPAWEAVLAFCRQSASHSVIASGDGTSSTVVLAAEIAKQVLSANAKWPQQFARQIEREAFDAIEAIKKEAIEGDDIVKKVAMTSTNGDEELAEVVIQAVTKSSAFGAILVEKNPISKHRYRITSQEGYSHCAGYDYNNSLAWSASSKAASNEPINWGNPLIAVFNGNLITERQLTPILSAWSQYMSTNGSKKLIIVAYEVSDEIANKLLVVNRKAADSGAAVFVVKPRLSAEVNSGLQVMRDIASFCGITDSHIIDGGNYDKATPDFFGTCEKIRITPISTVFMGRSSSHWVDDRIFQNLKIAEESRSQADKEMTLRRNAQLTEGLVKVEVGDGMMPDLQERADRFDDASKAAQACMRNGALPGCGASYIRAASLINASPALTEAFKVIHRTIMQNYGSDLIREMFTKGETIQISETGVTFGDAVELGVLDSTDTVCAIIKNGVELGVKIATLGGYSLRDNIGMVVDEL
jgi:chaperonin GroEL